MNSSKIALRAQRALRTNSVRVTRRNVRFNSTDAPVAKPAASGALTGGLAGAGATLAIVYGWYHFSGAKSAVATAGQAKAYVDSSVDTLKAQFKDAAPNTNEAVKVLRDTANKYASFIPGGKGYVDKAFGSLESMQKKHGDEVDKIVKEAYSDLRELSQKELSFDTASRSVETLSKHMHRLMSLAGDVAGDAADQFPEMKNKANDSMDKLKGLAESLGPKAKKVMEETRGEIEDLVKEGMKPDTGDKIKQLVEKKIAEITKGGE